MCSSTGAQASARSARRSASCHAQRRAPIVRRVACGWCASALDTRARGHGTFAASARTSRGLLLARRSSQPSDAQLSPDLPDEPAPDVSIDSDSLVRPFQRALSVTKVLAPPNAPPIVVLPGFGNCTDDYVAPFGSRDASIKAALEERGFNVFVVPLLQMGRRDWFNVARGVFTRGFWKRTLTTHPSYSWYLSRVRTTVTAALEESARRSAMTDLDAAQQQVILVGHSAGGWLARAFVGDPQWFVGDATTVSVDGSVSDVPNPAVRMVVTLGTPQRPPPPEKAPDMTGGAVTWVEKSFPGATFADLGVDYVCVCGETIEGRARRRSEPRTPHSYAHDAYEQVCGEGSGVVGDAVVPICSSLLPGADNVTIEGVFHSMSKLGTFEEPSEKPWYGSDAVVDIWLERVVAALTGRAAPAPSGSDARKDVRAEADGASAARSERQHSDGTCLPAS